MKSLALCLLLAATSAQAKPFTPGELVPSDAALSFVALGGGVAGVSGLLYDLGTRSVPAPKWMDNWYWRLPVEAAEAWVVGAALQADFGAEPTTARMLDYGNFAAFGAAGAWTISWGGGGFK